MQKTLAMILAGGQGRRMGIICYERPKPVLPFAGNFRVIDFSLSNCIHSRVDDVAILTDYQRYQVAEYLKRWNLANPVFRDFDILEPRAGFYKGTADAVYQNLHYLQRRGPDRVLILAGDHVYKMDYRHMLTFHDQVKADVTVGVVRVPIEETHRFGTVTTDSGDRILDFVEKALIPQSSLVSMGIYVFNTDFLAKCLAEDAAQPDSPHDFGYAVIPNMVKKGRVYAFTFDGYWQDIGTIEAYYAANMEFTRQKPSFSLNGTWRIFTEDNNSSMPRMCQRGTAVNSIVSPGCVIKGYVENSILSPGVRVEGETVVTNSVLMADVCVGYHSVVDHSILDEEVNIGEFCYVGFGTNPISGDCALAVLGKSATIPNHTAIGRNSKILPNVGHSDFSTSIVPSDTLVSP